LQIGLANRVVPAGMARQAAEDLARALAALPQRCMREDRLSAYEQHGLAIEDALENEHRHGLETLAGGLDGVTRFTAGAGRHGEPA